MMPGAKQRSGGRRKGAGRPPKGKEKLQVYVKPETVRALKESKQEDETLGDVLDRVVKQGMLADGV